MLLRFCIMANAFHACPLEKENNIQKIIIFKYFLSISNCYDYIYKYICVCLCVCLSVCFLSFCVYLYLRQCMYVCVCLCVYTFALFACVLVCVRKCELTYPISYQANNAESKAF